MVSREVVRRRETGDTATDHHHPHGPSVSRLRHGGPTGEPVADRLRRIGMTTRRPTLARSAALLATTTLAVLVLAGCSCGSSDSMDGAGGSAAMSQELPQGGAAERAPGATNADDAEVDLVELEAEKKVSHGTVSLTADDVADARAEVQRIVDTYAGQVAESQTETDEDGEVVRARMVLRVPVADFNEAMDRLEAVADLRSSDQASDVVTEQYADLAARVRAQEKSLERVEVLFARAGNIRDIMAIESELSRRQADLDSLKGQLRVLDDRTDLSTITVHLERTPEKADQEEGQDRAGFLVGLRDGWDALAAVGTGLATVAGALLPFAVAIGILAALLWLPVRTLLRSAQRRRPAPAAPPAE